MARYDHTQKAPLFLIFLAAAAILACMAVLLPVPQTARAASGAISAILAITAAMFRHLRVRDAGDHLSVRFGPLPLFGKRIPYSQILGADVGRSSTADGWGIHYMPGKGWIYNLWGRECVEVHCAMEGWSASGPTTRKGWRIF